MANRRIIGGMGNRGNRSFSQQPFQGNVSPWQGNMSNNLNQGLMNQLSNPQQLALALTSLLQPQQQQMNNPPSLLSLNAAPAFQDHDIGRYGNRGRSDFRRPEPYNKQNNRNSGNWRDQGNRNRNRNQGGGNRNNNKNNTQNRKNEEKNKEEKKPDVKEEKKSDTIDLSVDEGEDEKKRDWKEEKNTSDENAVEEKKEDVVVDEQQKEKEKEGKYFGIPHHLLHCFVCSKDMWDGESFQKHVRGRAHKLMLDSLEESMGITVNILREHMRLAEEKKMIELNRIQRLNKKPSRKFNDIESHCNMCDFKFLGKIMAHRKSEGHQRLKRFLHPNCQKCDKEFPSRMEWIEHRLTPEHLRALAKFVEEKSKADGAAIVKEDETELDLEILMDETAELEDEFPIVELDDDMHDLQNRIPAYRKTRLLGSKALVPFTGFMCEICNNSYVTEEQAQAHLKTKKHYLKFVETVKNKYQKQLQEEKEKEKNKNDKKDETADGEEGDNTQEEANDSEMYDPEEACSEGDKEMIDIKPNGDLPINTEAVLEIPKVEVKTEPQEQQVEQAASTRPKRSTISNVKNGAGPKSKKVKK